MQFQWGMVEMEDLEYSSPVKMLRPSHLKEYSDSPVNRSTSNMNRWLMGVVPHVIFWQVSLRKVGGLNGIRDEACPAWVWWEAPKEWRAETGDVARMEERCSLGAVCRTYTMTAPQMDRRIC